MSNRSYPPYLRLVETPALDEPRTNVDPRVGAADGALLGFVDMSRTTDVALETIIARLQPAWVFDLRPVPYFEIGRINRKHIFALFRISHTTYRDVAGHLRIRRRHDASLNSGAVASPTTTTASDE